MGRGKKVAISFRVSPATFKMLSELRGKYPNQSFTFFAEEFLKIGAECALNADDNTRVINVKGVLRV